MVVYYVKVSRIPVTKLVQFAREHIKVGWLLERARKTSLPMQCEKHGCGLVSYVDRYRKIPSDDSTIRFLKERGKAVCVQFSSGEATGGECTCRRIKDGLRKIVQKRLAGSLRRRGFSCRTFSY